MITLPYVEPVFRPPSEARSLILQVTNGCSWNNCTFCEVYTQPQKNFRLKPRLFQFELGRFLVRHEFIDAIHGRFLTFHYLCVI